MEVVRCDVSSNSTWNTVNDEYYDKDDEEEEFGGVAPTAFGTYFKHSKSLPALKSIRCGDRHENPNLVIKARIPADLANVQELIIAIDRPLELSFDSACSVGERLNTLVFIAGEVMLDANALHDMGRALSRRGLTLMVVRAGQGLEHAPSQCMYVQASAAPLSYNDAIQYVNARL